MMAPGVLSRLMNIAGLLWNSRLSSDYYLPTDKWIMAATRCWPWLKTDDAWGVYDKGLYYITSGVFCDMYIWPVSV